jgi:hypothetical protein
MTKAEKAVAKDVGGFVAGELLNGKRSNRTIRSRTMVTLDADKAYPGQWEDVALLCEYRMAMYSTHSHTPEEPRLRFIIPLDRPVSPDEYGAIARRLASEIGIETMDRTTYEPARLMYWPSCPADGEYLFRHQEGPIVCADEILMGYGPDDAWKDAALCLAERRVRHYRATNMFPGTPPRYASSARAASDALYLAACARLFDRPDLASWAQRCFDWIFGANNWNASYVEGVGQNQWQRPVFGQFFPSTPQLPGAVLHVDHGEYDMPPTALTLWTAAALEQLWSAAKSATPRNPAP